jgi:uroporphyrin-III C-methyltransferase/precorrin-2 dehydrogenase/sirohydrochlorin ferrochelatase
MRHFPIFMDLQGRPVLVLGRGEVAERKAEPLRRAGAEVRIAHAFDEALLDGCVLAVGADAPEDDLRALFAAASRRGIPVNTVDRPELCSFITPSIIDRDPITIAVSSSGTAPVLARLLRARIEALIPPAYGRLAAMADRFKADIRSRLPDLAARRRVLERLLAGRAADLVFAGREGEAEAEFVRALGDAPSREGMVFLVGAGPGSADLLTLRAQRLMGEADVIVHDRLVTEEVMDMARRDAERVYVGKARANHCLKQHEINALLVKLAREGKKVIRLKGGDPFIFGRGGEEAEALSAAGVPFEVVPGVTAALACAAQAGIPLTHRDAARSVTFATGHTKEGRLDLDFAPLVRAQTTLAIYMGIVSLPQLRTGLLAHGLDPRTPAALIERGGTSRQRELRGTLDELVARGPGWSTNGPTLVLIGPAVARGVMHKAVSDAA